MPGLDPGIWLRPARDCRGKPGNDDPWRLLDDHRLQSFQLIRLSGRLVPAQTLDAREAQGNAGLMPVGALDGIEGYLHDQPDLHLADRAESILGVVAHPFVELLQ